MDWVSKYIGIPYLSKGRSTSGFDCYGLVREVYIAQLGITLPDFLDDYEDADEQIEAANALKRGMVEFAEVNEPEPMDLIVLRIMGEPWHVGLYLGTGKMLHTMRGHASVIEKINHIKWRNRIEGFYRWEA